MKKVKSITIKSNNLKAFIPLISKQYNPASESEEKFKELTIGIDDGCERQAQMNFKNFPAKIGNQLLAFNSEVVDITITITQSKISSDKWKKPPEKKCRKIEVWNDSRETELSLLTER